MPSLLAHLVESGRGVERRGGMAHVDGEHAALVGEEAVGLGIASGESTVLATRRGDVDDQHLRIVLRSDASREEGHELRDLGVGEPDMVDAQRIGIGRTHSEYELGCMSRHCRSFGDAGEDGVDVVVRHEIRGCRQDLVEGRIEVRELRGEHRRFAPPPTLGGSLPHPADLVDAATVALCLAPVLHDRGSGQPEQRADLGQQADVVLAVGPVGLDRGEHVIGDERAGPLDLERFHDRDAGELARDAGKVAQHHRGRAEAAQQRLCRCADTEGQ